MTTTIPRPTGEIRRTVLVQLPENGRANGAVHCPDDDILMDLLFELPGWGLRIEGPLINGVIAVERETSDALDLSDEELLQSTIDAVHRALRLTEARDVIR